MRPNKRVNINTKGIKNFLVCLLKIKINTTAKINNSMGILLPESIIATKNMINKIGIKNLEYLDIFWKYKGKIKNEKIQNLCIKLPAISSSPNGPPNFLPELEVSKPKISFPKMN